MKIEEYTVSDLISICSNLNKEYKESGAKPTIEEKYEIGKYINSIHNQINFCLEKNPELSSKLVHDVLGIHKEDIVESSSNSIKTRQGLDFFIVRDNLYVIDLKTKKAYVISEKPDLLNFYEDCMGSRFSD